MNCKGQDWKQGDRVKEKDVGLDYSSRNGSEGEG